MSSINIYEDGIGFVELVDHMGNDSTIVRAARVSYGKEVQEFTDKDAKLIKYLYDNQHFSCFEHCVMTFRFKVPLFVRSQHHRHRTWAYNEISRRYTDENLQFYFPRDNWRVQSKSSKQASESKKYSEEELDKFVALCFRHCSDSVDLYQDLLDRGLPKEQARMILPQNLYTSYYGTVNLRNAISFLKLRLHPHAQYEIRVVAEAMKTIMSELYPETMKLVNF